MKKLLSVILALCVSLAVFAGVSAVYRKFHSPSDEITSSSENSSSSSSKPSSSSSSGSSSSSYRGIDLPTIPLR